MDGMTITEFILARVAEDEARARNPDVAYQPHLGACSYDLIEFGNDECVCQLPARVLAECEAKRRMVEWAAPVLENWPNAPKGWRYISDDGMDVLKILASPYSDHLDYRQEWR